ncbi:hypothetical protein OG21DRAFT_1581203 [Imleria badia]|nr:hypothetical protein OG21DRAFT_1581203 [Imleria badia]
MARGCVLSSSSLPSSIPMADPYALDHTSGHHSIRSLDEQSTEWYDDSTTEIKSTVLTLGLSAFLQAFYMIYTAFLVCMTQQLALSDVMARKQTLTAVHDIIGAWRGIGAAFSTLWQQTKVASSPFAILLILVYLSCISGLHVISSSVIQFEAFNNTVTSVVPSTVALPPPSVNPSDLTWDTISPLTSFWPLLTAAKGLTGTAAWNSGSRSYSVNVSGLGQVALPVSELGVANSVNWISLNKGNPITLVGGSYDYYLPDSTHPNYVVYEVSTGMELGNLTGKVLQVDSQVNTQNSTGNGQQLNISGTSYFVACVLNATTKAPYVPMQDGKITGPQILSNNPETELWTVWSPHATTELTQMFNYAQIGFPLTDYFCQTLQQFGGAKECLYIDSSDIYTNSLLNISWVSPIPQAPITLQQNEIQNAVSQTAALFLWLGTQGSNGGFQHVQGESIITNDILEYRLNVYIAPVAVGLLASIILLVITVWIFHIPHSTHFTQPLTCSGILGLMWISAKSKPLQDIMKRTNYAIPDQLRLKGTIDQVALADLAFESPDVITGSHWITTVLRVSLQAFYVLYTIFLVSITQQLAMRTLIIQSQYLTAVHDITQAWTGIGAAVSALLQQIKISSSLQTLLGVGTYLACISALHIISTTIMEFTPFDNTSFIFIPSEVVWPNSSTLNSGWSHSLTSLPPANLLASIQTNGLLNNTIYDILNITDSSLTSTIVNATFFTPNCSLLSNLTFSNATNGPTLNFSLGWLGSKCVLLNEINPHMEFHSARNQIIALPLQILPPSACSNSPCNESLYFLITTGVKLDASVSNSTLALSVNIAKDGSPSVMAYVAACTLLPQTYHAILNIQTGTLTPSPMQPSSQGWNLWSPVTHAGESSSPIYTIVLLFYWVAFRMCAQDGLEMCSVYHTSPSATNSSLYILTPDQLEESIGKWVATSIWTAGQLGSNIKGFDRTIGESQVTQVVIQWRLNVVFASIASLILFILVFHLIGMSSKLPQNYSSITGLSVLETLWVAAHSQTLQDHMANVDNPSLDNLRKEGMFKVFYNNLVYQAVI